MLENRPTTKKALYGSGAFMFVFAAAMLGTAFMISGGFGAGPDRSYAQPIVYQSWADTSAPTEQQARPIPARAVAPPPTSDQPNFVVDAIMPPAAAEETQTDDVAQADDAYTPDIAQDRADQSDDSDKPKAPGTGA